MTKTLLTFLFLVTLVAAAGCGRSTNSATTQQPAAGGATTATDAASALDAAVRRALRANYTLSLYTLWHDRVPATATQSTRGPALAGLRSSAAARLKRGVHIRVRDRHWTIVSLHLDPSYARATAVVQSRQHVRPYSGDLHPLGRAIVLNERARIELHRLGTSTRFVVWNVAVMK